MPFKSQYVDLGSFFDGVLTMNTLEGQNKDLD